MRMVYVCERMKSEQMQERPPLTKWSRRAYVDVRDLQEVAGVDVQVAVVVGTDVEFEAVVLVADPGDGDSGRRVFAEDPLRGDTREDQIPFELDIDVGPGVGHRDPVVALGVPVERGRGVERDPLVVRELPRPVLAVELETGAIDATLVGGEQDEQRAAHAVLTLAELRTERGFAVTAELRGVLGQGPPGLDHLAAGGGEGGHGESGDHQELAHGALLWQALLAMVLFKTEPQSVKV